MKNCSTWTSVVLFPESDAVTSMVSVTVHDARSIIIEMSITDNFFMLLSLMQYVGMCNHVDNFILFCKIWK